MSAVQKHIRGDPQCSPGTDLLGLSGLARQLLLDRLALGTLRALGALTLGTLGAAALVVLSGFVLRLLLLLAVVLTNPFPSLPDRLDADGDGLTSPFSIGAGPAPALIEDHGNLDVGSRGTLGPEARLQA